MLRPERAHADRQRALVGAHRFVGPTGAEQRVAQIPEHARELEVLLAVTLDEERERELVLLDRALVIARGVERQAEVVACTREDARIGIAGALERVHDDAEPGDRLRIAGIEREEVRVGDRQARSVEHRVRVEHCAGVSRPDRGVGFAREPVRIQRRHRQRGGERIHVHTELARGEVRRRQLALGRPIVAEIDGEIRREQLGMQRGREITDFARSRGLVAGERARLCRPAGVREGAGTIEAFAMRRVVVDAHERGGLDIVGRQRADRLAPRECCGDADSDRGAHDDRSSVGPPTSRGNEGIDECVHRRVPGAGHERCTADDDSMDPRGNRAVARAIAQHAVERLEERQTERELIGERVGGQPRDLFRCEVPGRAPDSARPSSPCSPPACERARSPRCVRGRLPRARCPA